ncbi:curli production assembly/transport protein CsgE [Photobacterium salinisoli]|uniref:curli production assembly/transport protein CsgE n=1 Tax=Photobacterium salinisoli TaxID=1616783 RepID=UPI001F08B574|nr:curli production assembly/transport protein CsgE [Photobacterium salinisoli]
MKRLNPILLIAIVLSNAFLGLGMASDKVKPLENGPPLENNGALELQGRLESLDKLREINGVVVDQTMTRLGEDFYSLFSQKLEDEIEELKENLTVKERPTALSGSIITIFHRQNIIFRTALSPGRQNVEEKTDQAVSAVKNYVLRWRIERYLKDTFDVDYDEI